eukprot:3909568-Alexandrium_andersonii.AAC.1
MAGVTEQEIVDDGSLLLRANQMKDKFNALAKKTGLTADEVDHASAFSMPVDSYIEGLEKAADVGVDPEDGEDVCSVGSSGAEEDGLQWAT